ETEPPQRSPLAALPFRRSPEGSSPAPAGPSDQVDLSLEQYAALCAEVSAFPQRADATFARYGLVSREDKLTIDAVWQDRLSSDPALMKRWQSLYLHYQEYYHRTAPR